LGLIKGVISTFPGFIGKYEVVRVEFDPEQISYKELITEAKKSGCAERVFTRSKKQHAIAKKLIKDKAVRNDEKMRPDKEPKYYLFKSKLRFVPMTPLQAARINAQLNRPDHMTLLSPTQTELLKIIDKNPKAGWKSAVGIDPAAAWIDAARIMNKINNDA